MKKKIIMICIFLSLGVVFTLYFLNNDKFYAKKDYLIYAFQIGAFKNYDNAIKYGEKLPSIIIEEDSLYKVYVGMYKDIDLVNKMLVYFENNNIHILLKNKRVSSSFYKVIDNYEKVLNNTNDELVYKNINESILKLYKEYN